MTRLVGLLVLVAGKEVLEIRPTEHQAIFKVFPIRTMHRKVPFFRIFPVINIFEKHLRIRCHARLKITILLMRAHLILNATD